MNKKESKATLQDIYEAMEVEILENSVEKLIISDERKFIEYSPNFQRNYIWSETKATNLVETVLMNGIVPPLTIIKKGKESVIIDGRQRYETLLRFYNQQFKLNDSGLQKLRDWGGRAYEELAPNLRTLFREYKLRTICYRVKDPMKISDKDLERMKRDLFRRYNFGMTSLKSSDIERAKYSHDQLTRKFEQLLKENSELYNNCVQIFLVDAKRKLDPREEINLLLIIIRELVATFYIPIIGEKNIQLSRKIIDKYYDEFIRKLSDKEQSKKLIEFEKILEKISLIKQRLKETNSALYNNVQFFKSVYWMLSICYNAFSNEFYDFKIDKFCHYVEDGAVSHFDTYNRMTGQDIEKRNHYMKDYMENELKLDLNIYLGKIKENKRAIIYVKDTSISKDKDWNSPLLLAQQLTTRRETAEMGEIISHIKQDRFVVRPYYQRGEVVNKTKASRVIESIFLGVKIPPIYLYTERKENSLNKEIVLDGQQRLIDILKYMGEPITNDDCEFIRTVKDKYALTGLSELTPLNDKFFKDEKETLTPQKKEKIEDYVFDVIRINKEGNENVDFVDIFIRLNQNPCPIGMNTFEMWNSFDIVDTIEKIKEIAKYKGFKQYSNTMKEAEIVTILAYMHYIQINIKNVEQFFQINVRTDNKNTKREKSLIKISVKNKDEITRFLQTMKPESKEEKEFLDSVNSVNDFVDKLKILSDDDESLIIDAFNPYKRKATKGDKNCFYITWLILQELDTHIIQTYKKEILKDLKETFKLMQKMPEGKNENDFMEHVKGIIKNHRK